MPTQEQYNTSIQTLRDIDCKIAVLDYDGIYIHSAEEKEDGEGA